MVSLTQMAYYGGQGILIQLESLSVFLKMRMKQYKTDNRVKSYCLMKTNNLRLWSILTFGAIPHVTAFPLANGAWLDIQQHTDLGRGLASFDQFLGLSTDVQW